MYKGTIRKMNTKLTDSVEYTLPIGEHKINMSSLIGEDIKLIYSGNIYCISCGNRTAKSFGQGFCYPCFRDSPMAAECIIRPELCRAHLGEGRDAEWEKKHHLRTHYVYLALSSGLKVGVTRGDQIPTRWIDQGASAGLILAEVPNRFLAGCIEVELKQYVSDKTNWQRMLKNEIADKDLIADKEILAGKLPNELKQYVTTDSEIIEINYPAIEFPQKVKSLNFDKTPVVEGNLRGIKGQYLIFENGQVINMRKYTGYEIEVR